VAAKKKQYKEEETHAEKEKKRIEDEASFVRNRWKKNSTEYHKINRKAREKEKRLKGQSSHDTWKPEAWIKLRQEFD
jgi:CRISPR/Cas system-associated protein Cas5 (RAMP superfamily)